MKRIHIYLSSKIHKKNRSTDIQGKEDASDENENVTPLSKLLLTFFDFHSMLN